MGRLKEEGRNIFNIAGLLGVKYARRNGVTAGGGDVSFLHWSKASQEFLDGKTLADGWKDLSSCIVYSCISISGWKDLSSCKLEFLDRKTLVG